MRSGASVGLEPGSMICGMFVDDSAGISSVAVVTGCVSALISGEVKVRKPACEGCVERSGLTGGLQEER